MDVAGAIEHVEKLVHQSRRKRKGEMDESLPAASPPTSPYITRQG